MKKHLLTLCLIIPFIGFSQKKVEWNEKDKFSIQFTLGTVFDHYSGTNNNYQDVSSNYQDDLRFSGNAGLFYKVNPKLSLGLDIGQGNIYGDNYVHSYQGEFEELNFNAKLNFLTFQKLELFGRVGSGVIRYQSERTVLNDDQSLISASKGEALKSSLGIGLEYRFKEQWSVLFDASFYRVDNENFDAWNDGLGNSKYYVTAVGIKYDLAKSSKSRKEEVLDHKKEIRRKIKAYNEANIEPRLQSIESKIANHSHQNKTEDKVVEQNEASDKLNHHFFFDKSEHLVSINSLERVIDIADFMKANTEYKAKITGYADSDAGNILNDKLSQKRAENIKKYLVSLGVNANRISTFYKGETSPLAPNDSQLNKQLNRRVDVLLSK